MSAVIIQARMGSSRLPGKSMADLGGRPVIDWVIDRCGNATQVSKVIVATSTNLEDDVLARHVEDNTEADIWRGDADDVLGRFVGALTRTDSNILVRVTGDCPFVQPELIDQAVARATAADYSATDPDGRFPRGFDVEAIRRDALIAAGAESEDPLEREHVTIFIVRRPERFEHNPLVCPPWARRPELRLTLDEANDLSALRAIVDGMGVGPRELEGPDLIAFLDAHPEIVEINKAVPHNIVK